MTSRIHLNACFLSIMLLCVYFLAGCYAATTVRQKHQGRQRNMFESVQEVAITRKPEQPQSLSQEQLGLQLSVAGTQWGKGNATSVLLRVENLSGTPLRLSGATSFVLVKQHTQKGIEKERETFFCPVDLLKKTNRRSGSISFGNLEIGQAMEVSLDLSSLKWKRIILSVPPTEDLFTVVPSGDYNLYFEAKFRQGAINIPDVSTEVPLTKQIKSNEVAISIR